MKITINGTEKEVEIKNRYTRRLDREYNDIIFGWSKTDAFQLQSGKLEIDLSNVQKANDWLITQMTNLSQDELDEMNIPDYNAVLQEIEKIKIPSGSWEIN